MSTITDRTPGRAAERTFASVEELERGLREQKYIVDCCLATTLYLTLLLGILLLHVCEAVVGKTECYTCLVE